VYPVERNHGPPYGLPVLAEHHHCIIPYLHINRGGSNLSHFSQWTFPILRVVGGFLTASMMPLVLQRRISKLTANRLVELNTSETPDATRPVNDPHIPGGITSDKSNTERLPMVDGTAQHARQDSKTGDIEMALGVTKAPSNALPADSADDEMPTTTGNNMAEPPSSLHRAPSEPRGVLDCVFLGLLFADILSSVVGYVGCFSVVQNASHILGLSAGCAWKLGFRSSE
jgi:hypothetical protein